MRVLLVTGRLAEPTVRKVAEKLEEVDVTVLPISVAAFITPEYAAENLMEDPRRDC